MPNIDVEVPSRVWGGDRPWPGAPIVALGAGVLDPLRCPSKTELRAGWAPLTCNN